MKEEREIIKQWRKRAKPHYPEETPHKELSHHGTY